MSRSHLLIESRGQWSGPGCARFLADAGALVRAGEEVCVYLVEDGVTAAASTPVPELAELVREGGRLWIDEFSLRQRALTGAPLVEGHQLVEMGEVADKLLDPAVRTVWH